MLVMRLAKPIETTGLFWLPEQPDTKLSGVLKISELGEITVDLAGMFGDPLVTPRRLGVSARPSEDEAAPDPGRIVGILERGGRLTLDRCLHQKGRFSLPGHVSTSTVSAELALVGAEYSKGEEVLFSEFRFSVEGLDAWLSISGIEIEPNTASRGGLIRYHVPDDIPVHVPTEAELRFRFGLTLPSVSVPITVATVQQTAEVQIKLREPRPIEYFSSMAFKLCNFLTLVLDEAVSIQSMTGYLDQETTGGESRRVPVKLYGQFAPWPEKKPTIRLHYALFRYPQVAIQLDNIMGKWFENYETFEPAFNLYFALRAQPSQFLDTKILWLCQALETFHRRSSDETEMSEEEFASLRKLVMQNCPPNRKQWLGPRLRNELSFRDRIKRLLGPLNRWFGDVEKREAFVKIVCDTRNYLTHYDEATTKNRAIGSDEQFELYEKLEALFQLHLLGQLGFDDLLIDSIIQGNRRLRRRLGI